MIDGGIGRNLHFSQNRIHIIAYIAATHKICKNNSHFADGATGSIATGVALIGTKGQQSIGEVVTWSRRDSLHRTRCTSATTEFTRILSRLETALSTYKLQDGIVKAGVLVGPGIQTLQGR